MIILRVALGISSSGRTQPSGQSDVLSETGTFRMNRRGMAVDVSHLVEVNRDPYAASDFDPKSPEMTKGATVGSYGHDAV